MSLVKSKKERIRFLKFAFVGVTGAIVDFGILNLLRILFNIPLVYAQAISFTCAVINNFIWNRYWTYPETRNTKVAGQLIKFFIINMVGIIIRTPLIPWLNNIILKTLQTITLPIPVEPYVISQNLSLAIAIFIVMLWNFFANRYWTYKEVPMDEDQIESHTGQFKKPNRIKE
jgi:putative flippase GtrA